jgi:hypothetical protein
MGCKGIALFCYPLLGDAEIHAIDCHETVVEHIVFFLLVKIDLRGVGARGKEKGGVRHESTKASALVIDDDDGDTTSTTTLMKIAQRLLV